MGYPTNSIPSGPGSNNLYDNGGSDATNDANMQADYQQWYSDEQIEQQDEESLATAIANLVNVSHEHNYNATFEAMMMFFTQVFPDVLNIQQDNLNTLSDTQNMSSDLRNFVTSIENDENTLSSDTNFQGNSLYTNSNTTGSGNPSWSGPNYTASEEAAANDLFGNTCDLYAWSQFLGNTGSAAGLSSGVSSALDPQDATNLSGYALNIANQLDSNATANSTNGEYNTNILYNGVKNSANNPTYWLYDEAQNPANTPSVNGNPILPTQYSPDSGFNIAYVVWYSTQNISYNSITNPPSGGITNGQEIWTDNSPIKTIQQDLQSANSGTSSLSTTTQTTEQFYTNQYNQLTGIDNSMQQNFAEEISAIIQNQASN